VNETPSEIIARLPELQKISFASNQDELGPLLLRIGENVEAEFADFPNTSSVEIVRQRRWGKVVPGWAEANQRFLYLVSVKLNSAEMNIKEYRSDSRGTPIEKWPNQQSFMLTTGYITQSLLFHPLLQAGSLFRLLGRASTKPGAYLIAFAQRPEKARSVGVFTIGEASIPLLVQGVAWIDPDTYRITRLWTDLLALRGDIGLKSQTTDAYYQEVRFEFLSHPLWLPRQVEVAVQWGGWIYSNRHRYSNYKVFSVEAQDGEKKLAKP
jgi:hypothetical protein